MTSTTKRVYLMGVLVANLVSLGELALGPCDESSGPTALKQFRPMKVYLLRSDTDLAMPKVHNKTLVSVVRPNL